MNSISQLNRKKLTERSFYLLTYTRFFNSYKRKAKLFSIQAVQLIENYILGIVINS